jgi:recombination protein RecT
MTGTDLVQRQQQIVAVIDGDDFRERVEPLLPDTVPFRRFVQLAKTAVRTNPDLAEAEERSLFGALLRCAQDGLYPDGREAAITVFNTKVKRNGQEAWEKRAQYLPMIQGLRKRLAEYGWTLKTRVVYSEDDFDYSEEPAAIRHVPVRPGGDRGNRIGAYAIATHRDGRRLQIFLDEPEIAKRRTKAKTKGVWDEWPDQMAEKSAGHAIEDEIPRSERDRMQLPADDDGDPIDALYGPDGTEFQATSLDPGTDAATSTEANLSASAPGTGGAEPQQAASSLEAAVPGADDEPEPQPEWVAAGETVVEGGNWAGKTIAEVAELTNGPEWIAHALARPDKFDPNFHQQLETYVAGALPELWAAHTEQSAA